MLKVKNLDSVGVKVIINKAGATKIVIGEDKE